MSVLDRLVADPDFRWLPGMKPAGSLHIRDAAVICGAWEFYDGYRWRPIKDCRPDIDDTATHGRLLALTREKHGDPHMYIMPVWDFKDGEYVIVWRVFTLRRSGVVGEGPTEGLALVDAFLAPVRST